MLATEKKTGARCEQNRCEVRVSNDVATCGTSLGHYSHSGKHSSVARLRPVTGSEPGSHTGFAHTWHLTFLSTSIPTHEPFPKVSLSQTLNQIISRPTA